MFRRALISVADKRGLPELGRALSALGLEILSTGGTARTLRDAGVPVIDVAAFTGAEEILGGRVKTLHPKVAAGILSRATDDDTATMARLGYPTIDLVVVNLYRFREATRRGLAYQDVVEEIDIGGPTLIRAAAKNHERTAVVVEPTDYERVLSELGASGEVGPALRRELAARAFAHTAAYDAVISAWFEAQLAGAGDAAASLSVGDAAAAADGWPERLVLPFERVQSLRYGENPHQHAALYRQGWDDLPGSPQPPSVLSAEQLQGKELSYNNILDLDSALGLVLELDGPGACVIKHNNPCGTAVHPVSVAAAYRRARAADPLSAFGGIVAVNRPVDAELAALLAETFLEAVLAPAFDDAARQVLSAKKNLRLLALGGDWPAPASPAAPGRGPWLDLRRVAGGLLVQEADVIPSALDGAAVATRRHPDPAERRALALAWAVVRHVKSNAIVLADEHGTIGVGAGQMSRVDSVQLALGKARAGGFKLEGSVMASDAFFPFRDSVDLAGEAGIRAVVQPGGSVKDPEVIAAADERGMAMLLTSRRHFRH
jgi:phosphoribosylaminoimidazolecarboxamide formyltransferase/IMP cyclohydrolase